MRVRYECRPITYGGTINITNVIIIISDLCVQLCAYLSRNVRIGYYANDVFFCFRNIFFNFISVNCFMYSNILNDCIIDNGINTLVSDMKQVASNCFFPYTP